VVEEMVEFGIVADIGSSFGGFEDVVETESVKV
jgi:predicted rRNA methylase YqxC with S4 and FtsJ domains